MRQIEISEIERRAALIAAALIDVLHRELHSLHARNAAKGCLRSGATLKESARIGASIVDQYFDQIEDFVRALPGGKAGMDSTIVDAVSESTRKLLDELWVSLRKTAALASEEKLVVHVKPQVEAALAAAQENFRSNLRAYWSQHEVSGGGDSGLLLALEIALFFISFGAAVAWLNTPSGPYEAWIAFFGLCGAGIDLYRRRVRAGAL